MTLGIGVAATVKEFHVQWNQPENLSRVIINLGNINVVMDFLVRLDHIYLEKLLTVRDLPPQR